MLPWIILELKQENQPTDPMAAIAAINTPLFFF
jgi:hypothetical protein